MPDPETISGHDPARALAENMRPLTEAASLPVADEIARQSARVFTGRTATPQQIAREASAYLADFERYKLFRRGGEFGTVNAKGKWEKMTAARLVTWLPLAGIIPYSKRDEKDNIVPGKFTVDDCRVMLESDIIRDAVPEIEAVHPVPLPVWRAGEGQPKKIELLPVGYDPVSKVLTLPGGAFATDWTGDQGYAWIDSLLKYFDFSDERGRAVQVAAMLSGFCRLLYAGRAPMFLWTANLEGSGKSALTTLALWPVFRSAAFSGYCADKAAEVTKELDAKAQKMAPYVAFDDVPPGVVRNSDLNRWITASEWSCRVLGSGEIFNGPVRALTFMTGNQVRLSGDLGRRSLIVDLFARMAVKDRDLPEDAVVIDEEFFSNEDFQARTLSALWALVHDWDKAGRPTSGTMASFRGWARIVPPMVRNGGLGDCLARFESPDSGDVESMEYEKLVKAIIADHGQKDRVEVTMKEIVGTARTAGLFGDVLWSLDEVMESENTQGGFKFRGDSDFMKREAALEWLSPGMASGWGKRFRKHIANGRHWKHGAGVWQFGDRSNKNRSLFLLTKVNQLGR